MNLFREAYLSQTMIGWQKFYRGFISIRWRHLQYKYFVELVYGDVHAMDKWARMVILNILEVSRLMWNERCIIVAKERDSSYEGRQIQQMCRLCKYLNTHPDEIPFPKRHLINRTEEFFSR